MASGRNKRAGQLRAQQQANQQSKPLTDRERRMAAMGTREERMGKAPKTTAEERIARAEAKKRGTSGKASKSPVRAIPHSKGSKRNPQGRKNRNAQRLKEIDANSKAPTPARTTAPAGKKPTAKKAPAKKGSNLKSWAKSEYEKGAAERAARKKRMAAAKPKPKAGKKRVSGADKARGHFAT